MASMTDKWLASAVFLKCTYFPYSVLNDTIFLYWVPLPHFVWQLKTKETMYPPPNGRAVLQVVLSCSKPENSDFRFLISSWYTPDFRYFSSAFRRTLQCSTVMNRQNIIINYHSRMYVCKLLTHFCHCCGLNLVWKVGRGLVLVLKHLSYSFNLL